MSRPFALLLCSRNVDNTPFALSFMIRSDTISVKYTLPSRSTVGPSVNATVVATSGLLRGSQAQPPCRHT